MVDDSISSSNRSAARAVDFKDGDSFDRVVETEERVFVDFYADWCGPCQLMEPVVEELATETEAAVVNVDVEAAPLVAHQYDVKSVPTFVVIEAGKEIDRLIGMQNKNELATLLE